MIHDWLIFLFGGAVGALVMHFLVGLGIIKTKK